MMKIIEIIFSENLSGRHRFIQSSYLLKLGRSFKSFLQDIFSEKSGEFFSIETSRLRTIISLPYISIRRVSVDYNLVYINWERFKKIFFMRNQGILGKLPL